MSTTVAYHAEYNGTAHPAINVKVHVAGDRYWPPEFREPSIRRDNIVSAAYDRVQSDFWQAAEEIATQRGLGEIAQEGRSGGWLVFTDGRDPDDAATFCEDRQTGDEHGGEVIEWLAGYRAMTEWAAEWIADAPRKVRELAQSMAMDEAGESAGLRMFSTFRAVSA